MKKNKLVISTARSITNDDIEDDETRALAKNLHSLAADTCVRAVLTGSILGDKERRAMLFEVALECIKELAETESFI